MGWLEKNRNTMNLVMKAFLGHLDSQWSSPTNFWSGIIGMLINNYLTLLGIWAMLFAGKPDLDPTRDFFYVMNFILMLAWGFIHIFLGGITALDEIITEGALDQTLTAPRSPFFILSLTRSDLPAWGDLILGFMGLVFFSLQKGFLFFGQSLLLTLFAGISLYAIFLFIGCMAFWFRRTDAIHSVLLNVCLAFNTYPLVDTGAGFRWSIFIIPLFFIGVLPARCVLAPTWFELIWEVCGSLIFFFAIRMFFKLSLKRYQSSSVFTFRNR